MSNENQKSDSKSITIEEEKWLNYWKKTSQDLYLIRGDNDEIKYIPFDGYRNMPKIEWFNSKDDHHFCFLSENGLQQENLIGQTITKVVPWNIQTARLPYGYEGEPLMPGFLIDLRVLHIGRLMNPTLQKTLGNPNISDVTIFNKINNALNKEPVGKNTPVTASPNIPQVVDDGFMPWNLHYQLGNMPFSNLYIVSWADPLACHNINEYSPYQINYMPLSELAKMEDAAGVSTGKLMTTLEQYYKHANVQVGALNPIDSEYLSLHGACYIANLNAFNR